MAGKVEKISRAEKKEKVQEIRESRDSWERKHMGGYRKIYPGDGCERYDVFIQSADKIWQEWTGAKVKRVKRDESEVKRFGKGDIGKIRKKYAPADGSESFDVFSRLSKPVEKKIKEYGYSLPCIVYRDSNFKTYERPTANINCLNLYSKALEQEERVLSKQKHSLKSFMPRKIEQKPTILKEPRIKKTSLKEILSLDSLKINAVPLGNESFQN